MITAKDQFNIEREHIEEMHFMLNNSNFSHDELEIIYEKLGDQMTEAEYDELKKRISDREITARDRIRNGEIVKQTQINEAVRQAIKND